LRKVTVKGRKHEFMIYELLGIANSNDPELALRAEDGQLIDMTRVASDCIERGDVAGAAQRYREILQLFPDDPVATVMLRGLATA
jgi:adenylate cyclase